MLLLRRAWSFPQIGLKLSQIELRTPPLILSRQICSDVGAIDLSNLRPSSNWTRSHVVLQGTGVMRIGGHAVPFAPGSVFVAASGQVTESLTADGDVLSIYQRVSTPDQKPALLKLKEPALQELRAISRKLATANDDDAVTVPLLQKMGHSLSPILSEAILRAALADRTPPELRAVAHVIEGLSCRLDLRPSGAHLAKELGTDIKRASEQAVLYFRRYHATVESWREYLNWLRIELGIVAMRCEGAETRNVSKWLGFRSPSAFCHAFQHAGLPAPQTFARRGVP